MQTQNGFMHKAGIGVALGIVASVSLLGCSGQEVISESSPSATSSQSPSTTTPKPTPSKSPTTKAQTEAPQPAPTTQPPAPAAEPAPAEGQAEASTPPRFMEKVPELNISTPEQAVEVLQKSFEYNPDLSYDARENGDGTFDVTVTSVSLAAQGGSGTIDTYEVRQDGNYFPISVLNR